MKIMENIKELGAPTEFWEYFEQISKIPRCSGKEEQIRQYVKREAEKFNFESKIDKAGNLLVRTLPIRDRKSTIILQSHLDMVCEKNENTNHDFSKDPLKLKVIETNGKKWLTAIGTTLGADNGVGMAYQLAIMKRIHRGELKLDKFGLDLLFTVNEEAGMLGAFQIDENLIQGTILINLDGGDNNNVIIGSVGGMLTKADIKIDTVQINKEQNELEAMEINIRGLNGGHSGVDIHRGLANSIKLMAKILWKLNKKFSIYINSINGGKRHNVIPRESNALIIAKSSDFPELFDYINSLIMEIKSDFSGIEENINVSIQKLKGSDTVTDEVFTNEAQNKILNLLLEIPNGPIILDKNIKDLVHTSTNLASVLTKKHRMNILTSQRSFEAFSNKTISDKIISLFKLSNLDVKLKGIGGYGGWQPNFSSKLLDIVKETYREIFQKDIKVIAVHAGLEPGIFKTRFPELELISIGPNILNLHSPDERLEIKSIEKFWHFFIGLLRNLST